MRGIRLYIHPSASKVKPQSLASLCDRDDPAPSTLTGELDKPGASSRRPNARAQRAGRAVQAPIR